MTRGTLPDRFRWVHFGTTSWPLRTIALALFVLVCVLPLRVGAQAVPEAALPAGQVSDDEADKQETAPKVKVERGAGGRKVFRITTGFVIEGRIQKPNAFYVLQRSQINYDWAQLTKDFTGRILDAVNDSPF